jgi:hypothetical protein
MANLKPIETTNIVEVTDVSDFYTVNGSYISWSYIPNFNDPGFATNSLSHFWSIAGLYSNRIANNYNISNTEGGFKDTSLQGLYDSYYTNGAIVGVFDPSAYRKAFNGNDNAFSISISGGTGPLSGLTGTTLYSTFFNQPQMLRKDGAGECSPTLADSLYFETLTSAVVDSGIGQNPTATNSKNNYESGIVYLFSDDLSFTSGSTSGQSFSTGHQVTNAYLNGSKLLAEFNGSGYHNAVGFVDCITGLVFLWDEYLVNSFAWGLATGGTGTTMATFPPNVNYFNTKDIDTTTKVDIRIQANPEEFYTTVNPSFDQAINDGVPCEEKIKTTQICLYDSSGNCTAVAPLTEAETKFKDGFFITNISFDLSGGILDNPFLLENGGAGLYLPT